MVRTERVRATADSDAMLRGHPSEPALRPEDLHQARTVYRVATSLNARDPIQYWKSAPFLLNVMRGYKLKERLRDRVADPPPGLTEALCDGDASLLKRDTVERYAPIEPANPRLRQLLDETVGQGQWKWLWMPPALPYLEPDGPYAGTGQTTKALVFSSWNVVPDAIAALCSYEVSRLMLERESRHADHPAYSELHRSRARLLDFPMAKDSGEPREGDDSARRDRPGAMNILPLFYPSPSLSEAGDPLSLAGERGVPVASREALEAVMERLRRRFHDAGVVVRADMGGEIRAGQTDQRWYWVAPAMLDCVLHPGVRDWVNAEYGWASATSGSAENRGFRRHVVEFGRAMAGRPDLGEPMGTPPEDLLEVLALVALAGPGVCAHRALRRIADMPPTSPALLAGASRIAHGLRGTFNLPECISLVRSLDDELKERTAKTPHPPRDHHTRYWELVLRYALAGNLQAVLDEYAHVLEESLGLMGHSVADRVDGISKEIVEGLSIRTSQVRIDDIRCAGPGTPIEMSPFNMRTRFALRFGDLHGERGESIQRADTVRKAFNSPFRPFVLATTSIGQEGLDFHTYCHAVYHWNLPRNPVDLEQREGRVHRYKGHAVRKNVAERYSVEAYRSTRNESADGNRDPWKVLFQRARDERPPGSSDLVPYWIFEHGNARVERRVPMLPFSSEVDQLRRLLGSLAVYRLAFGQPRQEDLVEYLRRVRHNEAHAVDLNQFRISLRPPQVTRSG
ncbi:MAG: SWF/SNF helicase family protein [Gemmatimonadetes bacterium]|nr:SWF/SNF helicase family protein [Gemmatimonadota bacterium]